MNTAQGGNGKEDHTAIGIWRDKQFGKSGLWAWLSPLPLLVLIVLFIIPIVAFSYHVEDFVFTSVLFLTPAAWGVFYVLQVKHVLQEVALEQNSIRGKFYFGRKITFLVSDIKAISFYRMTFAARNLNFLDQKNPGIDIELKTGEKLRISHKMEDFSGLVSALEKMIGNKIP